MELKKPTYTYLTDSTRKIQSNITIETASAALNELAETLYVNVRTIAIEMMKKVIMPFCIEYDFEFKVNSNRGTFTLQPKSDKSAPKDQLDEVLEAINKDTCLTSAPKLFMLMPSFSTHFKGSATTINGEKVDIEGFHSFDEHKCPHGWLGGYVTKYGKTGWTGTFRPDELVFG